MQFLPKDILINEIVVKHLNSKDIANLRQVSKEWNELFKDENVWKLLVEKQFPFFYKNYYFPSIKTPIKWKRLYHKWESQSKYVSFQKLLENWNSLKKMHGNDVYFYFDTKKKLPTIAWIKTVKDEKRILYTTDMGSEFIGMQILKTIKT